MRIRKDKDDDKDIYKDNDQDKHKLKDEGIRIRTKVMIRMRVITRTGHNACTSVGKKQNPRGFQGNAGER